MTASTLPNVREMAIKFMTDVSTIAAIIANIQGSSTIGPRHIDLAHRIRTEVLFCAHIRHTRRCKYRRQTNNADTGSKIVPRDVRLALRLQRHTREICSPHNPMG